ncbi:hypothetical protein MC885_018131, partial [Smutsia gigantea]
GKNTELPPPHLVSIRLLSLLLQIPDHPLGEDAAFGPESLAGLQVVRSTEQGDPDQLKELYSAGNLTVLATACLPHQDSVQVDFHFHLTPQTSAHWHGLLCDHRLFLDIPYRALEQGNRERRLSLAGKRNPFTPDPFRGMGVSPAVLTATLEYVEEKTNVDSVFVNFQNNWNDRGPLLRAFSCMGFEVVRPDHPPSLPGTMSSSWYVPLTGPLAAC